jgi:hypothetical protein
MFESFDESSPSRVPKSQRLLDLAPREQRWAFVLIIVSWLLSRFGFDQMPRWLVVLLTTATLAVIAWAASRWWRRQMSNKSDVTDLNLRN